MLHFISSMAAISDSEMLKWAFSCEAKAKAFEAVPQANYEALVKCGSLPVKGKSLMFMEGGRKTSCPPGPIKPFRPVMT